MLAWAALAVERLQTAQHALERAHCRMQPGSKVLRT